MQCVHKRYTNSIQSIHKVYTKCTQGYTRCKQSVRRSFMLGNHYQPNPLLPPRRAHSFHPFVCFVLFVCLFVCLFDCFVCLFVCLLHAVAVTCFHMQYICTICTCNKCNGCNSCNCAIYTTRDKVYPLLFFTQCCMYISLTKKII